MDENVELHWGRRMVVYVVLGHELIVKPIPFQRGGSLGAPAPFFLNGHCVFFGNIALFLPAHSSYNYCNHFDTVSQGVCVCYVISMHVPLPAPLNKEPTIE